MTSKPWRFLHAICFNDWQYFVSIKYSSWFISI